MAIGLESIPRLTVEGLDEDSASVRVTGQVDRLARLSVGLADLCTFDDLLLSGRILVLDVKSRRVVFETNDLRAGKLLTVAGSYPIFDGYWGERAELVLDSQRVWNLQRFLPSDAFATQDGSTRIVRPADSGDREQRRMYLDSEESHDACDQGGARIEGGWDHEHCAICWETISQASNCQHDGYVDQNGIWVCISCFDSYVAPKSLAFPVDQ